MASGIAARTLTACMFVILFVCGTMLGTESGQSALNGPADSVQQQSDVFVEGPSKPGVMPEKPKPVAIDPVPVVYPAEGPSKPEVTFAEPKPVAIDPLLVVYPAEGPSKPGVTFAEPKPVVTGVSPEARSAEGPSKAGVMPPRQ